VVTRNGVVMRGFALGEGVREEPLASAMKQVLEAAKRFTESLSAKERQTCGICLSASHLEEAIVAGDFARAAAHAEKIVQALPKEATTPMGWTLVHRIFEGDELVVEHRFFGRTKEDAHHIFEAHMKTDSFLRGCETEQHFRDFDCSTEWFWERTNK
jgi:hypothetical protein